MEENERRLLRPNSMSSRIIDGFIEPFNGEVSLTDAYLRRCSYLRLCTSSTALPLPAGFCVSHSLKIFESPQLQMIPEGITIPHELFIINCPSLAELPGKLKVGNRLCIRSCQQLRMLPESLCRVPHIQVNNCRRLEAILGECAFFKNLDLQGCTSLFQLPDRLEVTGAMLLDGCVSIRVLPRRLHVSGRLSLAGCSGLRTLPRDLMAGGEVEIAGTRFDRIPETLAELSYTAYGQKLPSSAVLNPEAISLQSILKEHNPMVREFLINRFGLERFMVQARAKVIDEDGEPGGKRRLLQMSFEQLSSQEFQRWRDWTIACLQVRCPSTGNLYYLRVPPETATCKAGAAWLAGLDDASQYGPVEET